MTEADQKVFKQLMREREVLFSLLTFVEKQYIVLKPELSVSYLCLHAASRAYLDQDFQKNESDDLAKTLATCQHLRERVSQQIAVAQKKMGGNISLISSNIQDDIAYACASTYLPQLWPAADLTTLFDMQQELLHLQEWGTYLQNQSWMVKTDLQKQNLLYTQKSYFRPPLKEKTWMALYRFIKEKSTGLAFVTLNHELDRIKKIIQSQEQDLVRQRCSPAHGIDHMRLLGNHYYYQFFPSTLAPAKNESFPLWPIKLLASLVLYHLIKKNPIPSLAGLFTLKMFTQTLQNNFTIPLKPSVTFLYAFSKKQNKVPAFEISVSYQQSYTTYQK